MNKNEKGITLVILVITIILLLILTTVTISYTIGGDGIIFKSKEAKFKDEVLELQYTLEKQKTVVSTINSTNNYEIEEIESRLQNSATRLWDKYDSILDIDANGSFYYIKENVSPEEKIWLEELGIGELKSEIKLSNSNIILSAGRSYEITASLTGNLSGNIEWTSNDENVTVEKQDETTVIIKVSNEAEDGKTAIVTATCGEKQAECIVNSRVLLGKYVKWNSDGDDKNGEEIWRVLYDDDTNGLQIISNEAMLYNGELFYLGYNDSLANWEKIKKIDEDKDSYADADIDKDGNLSDFEKAFYSYNNVAETLNKACDNLIKDRSILKDKDSVRCVATNPTDKTPKKVGTISIPKLAELCGGIYDKKIIQKEGFIDLDSRTMGNLNIKYDKNSYWLPYVSYRVSDDRIEFWACYTSSSDYVYTLCRIYYENERLDANSSGRRLRPVVTLNPNVKIEGVGTQANPYTINI